MPAANRPALPYFAAAFAAGCVLAMMTHLNAVMGFYSNAMFASWTAHATGTAVSIALLGLLRFKKPAATAGAKPSIPWWAYLGGVFGAATVVCAALAVNSPLALSGTIAIGLASQVLFSLAADYWGFFGLPARKLDRRDLCVVALILTGGLLVILAGATA
ncbi:DMT family transporter [Martelella soudanensis]|uniref:DMT family transporter n=1 Tax=unclassified Martelella TaxID=2629616 RepID=UPI0015DFEA8E|nr:MULTISPECIES: DMT family transporter [unclassified Martelella]